MGKWNHSEKPSKYEFFNEEGEKIYSGPFKGAMKYKESKSMEIMDEYDAGYYAGKREIMERGMDDYYDGVKDGYHRSVRVLRELQKKFPSTSDQAVALGEAIKIINDEKKS